MRRSGLGALDRQPAPPRRVAPGRRKRFAYSLRGRPGGGSVVSNQLDIFLFEPRTDRYLGRLCRFNQCPKGKRDCLVPGCGEIPFNKRIADFEPRGDLLAPATHAMLYRRDTGRLRSALDFPGIDEPPRL